MEINNVNLQANHVGLRPRLTEKCPRCNSTDSKFCYYNNYSLNQPRHYCKTCRRYWTQGGICRNIPIGGSSYRRNRKARAAHPDATLDPNVPTFAKRRRRSTNVGSINVSGGRGRRSIIPSVGVNFPNELENRVSEFGHTMSSFGSTPVLSFNNNVVNVNNNVSPGLGTFQPPRPPPPALMNGDAWHQESLSLTSVQQDDNMCFWSFDGPPLFPYDIDVVINDQWLHDLPEYTLSAPLPPPPPSA